MKFTIFLLLIIDSKKMSTQHAKEFKDFNPSSIESKYYWQQWMTLDRYRNVEDALLRLFKPRPNDKTYLDQLDLLIKCSALNDFYSTNIYSVYRVVEHYSKYDLAKRMAEGDLSLVEDLRKVKMDGKEKPWDFYSFATKFCAHHNPEAFPIYDSYVDKMLRELRNRDDKIIFRNDDLKDYVKFRNILCGFRKEYGIEDLSFREVDIMLWLGGKEYFPIKYNKKTKTDEADAITDQR